MKHPDFNPPGKPPKLTSRRSTITGLFFTTLTPYVEPDDSEVDEALAVLGMSRGECVCAYCGDTKSEWDHFRAVVVDRKPTGYITEIANLVPACGKCNQSRGNREWREWMQSDAPKSPKTRGVSNLAERMKRLEAFEAWRKPIQINYSALAGADHWEKHISYLDSALTLLEKAESHAASLRALAIADAQHQLGEKK